MTSAEAIRFSWRRKSRCPRRLMADMAATPPRLPVTFAFGVWPHGAQVFPRKAVNETFDSS
jgi:hypothetical protein